MERRADRRYGNRSFERVVVVAEAHHPLPRLYVTESKRWSPAVLDQQGPLPGGTFG